MFRLIHKLMFSPDAPGGVVDKPSGDLSKNDIIDYLGKDDDDKELIPLKDKEDKDDEKPEKKETKDDKEADEDNEEDKEGEETEEDDELEVLEDELDEPDEEKLELAEPTSRREILKKYPKLFKDFPYLETAYYREQEFTKILPTIKDAKEAVEKSHILDNFENDLSKGNTEVILKAVKDNDPKAFSKIIDDYMTTLSKVDEKAYHHVLGNTIKHTIMAMIQESRSSQNEALEQAATILNQFIFGSSKFTPPSKLSADDAVNSETDKKEKAISDREKAFTKQKFTTANDDLSTRVNKTYKATIEANIDPKKSMTDYVRKTASREAFEELETLIGKDTRFKVLVDKLWERAFKNDFDSESLNKIRSAFISKAQTLLPSVIKKARQEALKGMSSKSNSSNKDDDSRQSDESKNGNDSSRRKESSKGEESHRRNDSGRSNKGVPSGMSSLEYLMSED